MRHILLELEQNNVTTLPEAIRYLINNGYISVNHLYYQDIHDYYKALVDNYQDMETVGYKLKAREETMKHFKISRSTFFNVMSIYKSNTICTKKATK